MSRAVAAVRGLISAIGLHETSIVSIRLISKVAADNLGATVLEIAFSPMGMDTKIPLVFSSMGLFIEDQIECVDDSGHRQSYLPADLQKLFGDSSVKRLIVTLSREPSLGQPHLIDVLRRDTVFGFGDWVQKHAPVTKVSIFYGVSTVPLKVLSTTGLQARVYKSRPWVAHEIDGPFVEFVYLDESGLQRNRKLPLDSYLDSGRKLRRQRYLFKPKRGFKVLSLFSPAWFSAKVPLPEWSEFKEQVFSAFDSSFKNHMSGQVQRLEARIKGLPRRRQIKFHGESVGFSPRNEIETIILLERMILRAPSDLPFGIKLKLLECSPQDIDAICEYSRVPNGPASPRAVEFEYSLRSFFAHGHDPQQVALVICYTLGGMEFPFEYFGMTYSLERGKGIPRIHCSADGSAVDCLILEEWVQAV